MKKSMKTKSIWFWGAMVGAVSLMTGCNVGIEPTTAENQASMMQQLPAQKEAPAKVVKAKNATVPGNVLLKDTTMMKDPSPLFPKGVWVGTFTPVGDGEATTARLVLRQVKKAALHQPKPKRSSFWSSWSLFRSAHACGPYAPALTAALEGEWYLKGQYPVVENFSGEGRSHDGFRRSTSFSMQTKNGLYLSGHIYKDRKTGVISLRGSLMRKVDKRYTAMGRFLLTRKDDF